MSIKDRTAHYTITATYDLEFTADVVSKVLEVSLAFDASGYYEEYPAYVGCAKGLKVALLGIPAPEDDLSDSPSDSYDLHVTIMEGVLSNQTTEKMDEMILKALNSIGGFSCSANGWGT